MKQMVSHARYGRIMPINDPFMALQRDSRSATTSGSTTDDAALLKAVSEGPMTALEALVAQHRNSHVKLIQAMQDAEVRHRQVNTYKFPFQNLRFQRSIKACHFTRHTYTSHFFNT